MDDALVDRPPNPKHRKRMLVEESKVVTLELSAEAAESLRQRKILRHPVIGEDDWNEEIALPQATDATDEDDATVASVDSDATNEVSLSPPPSQPLLQIDLERLVGYEPANREEAAEVAEPFRAALWGDETECYGGLDERLLELFESSAARHVCSADALPDGSRYTTIEYPPVMLVINSNSNDDDEKLEVLDTQRVWKQLLHPHNIDIVNQMLELLRNCSRPLTWKHSMAAELRTLARSEIRHRQQQRRAWELYSWRGSRRKNQLEQLYNVRERLQEKLEGATQQVNDRVRLRDLQVKAALREQYGGGEDGENNKNNIDNDDDVDFSDLFGALAVDDDDDDDYDDDGGFDHASEDSHSQFDGSEAPSTASSTNIAGGSQLETPVDESPMDQLSGSESAAEAVSKKKALEAERAETELALRETYTSTEMRLSIALKDSLVKKLAQIDDLLESLQEEEWQDEEEGIHQPPEKQSSLGEMKASLLDQVLAMILGSTPPPLGMAPEEFMKWQRERHRSIVDGWLDHFGRLPEPLLQGPAAAAQKSGREIDDDKQTSTTTATTRSNKVPSSVPSPGGLLGEDGSVVDNWEDAADDDWDVDSPTTKSPAVEEKPRPVGLRPGGRIS